AEFDEAADLLKKAMALSPRKELLAQKLERARNAAVRAREDAEITETMALWGRGARKEALLNYVKFSDAQRERFMKKSHETNQAPGTGRHHFSWLARILSDQPSITAGKMVAAVMALAQSGDALQKSEDPRSVVSMLQPHVKTLGAIPEARDMIERAERMLKTREYKKAETLLQKARAFLAEGNLDAARERVDQIRPGVLNDDHGELFNDISARLEKLEGVRTMKQTLRGAEARGDYLAARDIARGLIETEGPDDPSTWREKIVEYTTLIKKEWSLGMRQIEDTPGCYSANDEMWRDEESNICLTPDHRHLILASSHGRVVFLRTFSIDENKFKQATIFRAPGKMTRPAVALAGNEIWIAGEECTLVALSLDPLDILFWGDFREFVGSGHQVEEAWPLPRGRCLWLKTSGPESVKEDACLVINWDKRRVERRFKWNCRPIMINFGGAVHAAINKVSSRAIQVYSDQGKPIRDFALGEKTVVQVGGPHPNGSDYLFLTFQENFVYGDVFIKPDSDGDPEKDMRLTMEVMPNADKTRHPLKIEGSSGQWAHTAAVSLADGLVFIFFDDDSSTYSGRLMAFRPTEQGFERLYQLDAPRLGFATDEFSQKVAAMYLQGDETRALLLDEKKPVFAPGGVASQRDLSLPSFDGSRLSCGAPTGALNARVLSFIGMLNSWHTEEIVPTSALMMKLGSGEPEDHIAYIHALKRCSRFDVA
ncbi:MAG: hypothetical protein GY859_42975, partial [Desulfobacterales bacterium]|nr:hypothetical protein [Desulfobacterales bacterium]